MVVPPIELALRLAARCGLAAASALFIASAGACGSPAPEVQLFGDSCMSDDECPPAQVCAVGLFGTYCGDQRQVCTSTEACEQSYRCEFREQELCDPEVTRKTCQLYDADGQKAIGLEFHRGCGDAGTQ